MTTWCKVEITKTTVYAVEIENSELSHREQLDIAADIAAAQEDDFERLEASLIKFNDLGQTLSDADEVIALTEALSS